MPPIGHPGCLTFAGLLRRILSHLATRLPGWRLRVHSSDQVVAVDFADDSAVDIDAGEARLRRPGEEALSFLNGYGPGTLAPKPPAETPVDLQLSTLSDGAVFEIPAADDAGQSDPDTDGLGF
ncbi:hypothetical protein KTN05_16775 [Paracoccus sp. Z118]|uniref:hypothetical protein n=1 Tax=Paracoccus sp. Z118 TaxID=2851017 RepID=UPI001C2BD19A|nr:hypothetical protein [Paracoccus sp. Z118]MBV0893457.1 hypothetical protein [Paracoccus sp. Z118]